MLSHYLCIGQLPEGAFLRPLVENPDERGSFAEFFCESWQTDFKPVQWSIVKSKPGSFRGMHLHRRHDEFFFLVSGRCCVGLRDIRVDSTTANSSCLLEFSAQAPAFVSFPRGILHGWYFFEDSIHIQGISDEEYSRYHEDDNLGCHWSDPDLEIPWPEVPTIVSERADRFPTLAALLRTLEAQT